MRLSRGPERQTACMTQNFPYTNGMICRVQLYRLRRVYRFLRRICTAGMRLPYLLPFELREILFHWVIETHLAFVHENHQRGGKVSPGVQRAEGTAVS